MFSTKQEKVFAHKYRNKQQVRLNHILSFKCKICTLLLVVLELRKRNQCIENILIFINVAIGLFNTLIRCKLAKPLTNT